MGARRVSPVEIVEMQRLYKELGTYAAVARKIGRSANTVSRYVQMKGVPQNIRLAVQNMTK
ncbi:MAG: helix-turn-helix domain-containing protein [Clostridia bacterium]|nr:helix-turn-helix domain-containing protein [Clostridia bacterium]